MYNYKLELEKNKEFRKLKSSFLSLENLTPHQLLKEASIVQFLYFHVLFSTFIQVIKV